MRHACEVKTFDVTTKKWQWIKSKNEYGNVSKKIKKYRCMKVVEKAQVPANQNQELGKQAVHGVEIVFGKSALGTSTAGNNGEGSRMVKSESFD